MDTEQEKAQCKEQNAIWRKACLPLMIPLYCVVISMVLFLSLDVFYYHSKLFETLTWVFASAVFILVIINVVMMPRRVVKLYREKVQQVEGRAR